MIRYRHNPGPGQRRWTVYPIGIGVAVLTFFLGGCQTGQPKIIVSPTVAIPTAGTLDRPPLEVPGFQLSVPVRLNERTIKRTTACKAAQPRDDDFWARCGAHPVDPNSNLVVGFDAKNLKSFGATVEGIDSHVRGLNARIDAANRERDYWRQRASQLENGQ